MKPKTDLPWIFERKEGADEHYGPTYEVTAASEFVYEVTAASDFVYIMADTMYYPVALEREDAEYAVHSANAYPRLVECLKQFRNAPGGSEADSLLAELGEDQ